MDQNWQPRSVYTPHFHWTQTSWMQWLGWPVMVGLFILVALHFQNMGLVHYNYNSIIHSHFSGDLIITISVFCILYISEEVLESRDRWPRWYKQFWWYFTSNVALVLWISVTNNFNITMIYWIMGVTLGWEMLKSAIKYITTQQEKPLTILKICSSEQKVPTKTKPKFSFPQYYVIYIAKEYHFMTNAEVSHNNKASSEGPWITTSATYAESIAANTPGATVEKVDINLISISTCDLNRRINLC
ncbi:hypothetical protein [Acidithiobacillus ferrivorans]|uniref:hypothetical protein n=1 Tax=Acidithiobacillus ferrivorans TaxID=160808 RepID=UPI001178A873|nr:hypothetical protein [Acidithiobacillus ferrivorans]